MTDTPFAAGQRWTYRAPAGFEASRIVIGAILAFADSPSIVCCAVTGAPRRLPDGGVDAVTIPFLPMTEAALRGTIIARDGDSGVDESFTMAFELWRDDERGLSAFSVPFEGFLDRMIALQMAAIIGAAA